MAASRAWKSRVYTQMETATVFMGTIVVMKLNLSDCLVSSVYHQEGTSDADVEDIKVI